MGCRKTWIKILLGKQVLVSDEAVAARSWVWIGTGNPATLRKIFRNILRAKQPFTRFSWMFWHTSGHTNARAAPTMSTATALPWPQRLKLCRSSMPPFWVNFLNFEINKSSAKWFRHFKLILYLLLRGTQFLQKSLPSLISWIVKQSWMMLWMFSVSICCQNHIHLSC